MGCACNQKKNQWQVIAGDGTDKVLFTSSSEATAKAVSGRYPNSTVQEKPKETPAATAKA
jgi:hypothetical protein